MKLVIHTPLAPVAGSRKAVFSCFAKAPDCPLNLLVGDEVEIEGKPFKLLEAKSCGIIVPGCMLQVLGSKL